MSSSPIARHSPTYEEPEPNPALGGPPETCSFAVQMAELMAMRPGSKTNNRGTETDMELDDEPTWGMRPSGPDFIDADEERLSQSMPSPLQFLLTYEYLRDQAEEARYAQQPMKVKLLGGVLYGVLAVASVCLFMVAITLLGTGISLLLSCHAKDLFAMTDNPVAGVAVGIFATALVHSSSTVTSLTVAVVGTHAITLRHGIYVVMGANIGTCVSAVMVAFGQARDRTHFERALGAAMVHTMYNIWSVVVLLPLELVAHPLEELSWALANLPHQQLDFQNPIKAWVVPLAEMLLKLNQKSIYSIAAGEACTNGTTFVQSGLLASLDLNDRAIGAIAVVIALLLLVITLTLLVHVFSRVFIGGTKRALQRIGQWNGYVNIIGSTIATFVLSSSSLVTSILTPLVGLEVFTVEQSYPLIIGANLGTTANALIAAFVSSTSDAIAMALVHFWFNVFGIVLFFMLPITRQPVLTWSRSLATYGASWLPFGVLFTLVVFYVFPAVLLLLITACRSSSPSHVVLGYLTFMFLAIGTFRLLVWYYRKGGQRNWQRYLARKRLKRDIRKYGGELAMPMPVSDDDMMLFHMRRAMLQQH